LLSNRRTLFTDGVRGSERPYGSVTQRVAVPWKL
jgi:hypothetical protein